MTVIQLTNRADDLRANYNAYVDRIYDKKTDPTADEIELMNIKKAQVKEAYDQVREKQEASNREAEAAGREFDKRRARTNNPLASDFDDNPSGGFANHRDFLGAVMGAGMGRGLDSRLGQLFAPSDGFRATQGSDEQSVLSDPHGGFLVPTQIARGILSVGADGDPLSERVRRIPMTSPIVKLNARVDKDHSTSVSGGLVVTRTPETVDAATSRMQFEQVTLNAHKLVGATFTTEEVLTDSAEAFLELLQASFAEEFSSTKMRERISGGGTGEFLGVLNSPCKITVSKETGQAAATIVTENIDKMAARCWRYSDSIYLANRTTRPQLRGLVRVVGTGGSTVPYFTTAPNGQELLDGRPIFFTEHCKALGTEGDLILGNWSEYLEGTYQPFSMAESIHVRFLAGEHAFRFWLRNDAAPWWRTALTPKYGDTISPFVTLATR